MNKGIIWMLHSVEDDSPRTRASELYRNLTLPPAKLEEFVMLARRHGATFVSMEQFLSDMMDGAEHRNILITVDDGLRNIYTTAFPLLRRLKVPFAFFVAADFVEHGFRNCLRAEMDGMMIVLDQALKRGADFGKLFRRYRRIRRLLPFCDGRLILRLMFGKGIDFDRYQRETVCSVAELRELARSGICEVGSHTLTHVRLDRLRVRELERELVLSQQAIERWTGVTCRYFSFPYGHANELATECVRKHYEGAVKDVVSPPFAVTERSDRHLLPRIICTRETPLQRLLPL